MHILSRTIKSCLRPDILKLMIACAILALLLIIILVTGLTWLVDTYVVFETKWLDTLVNWASGIAFGVGGWFMLPAFTVIIGGAFQETAISRVEMKDYPESVRSESPKFWPDIWHDVKFTAWALFLNLLILPLHFFFIGFIAAIVLNTYLLGREFFESAAGYHMGKKQAKEFGQQHRAPMYIGGFVITMMTLVPVLNLFVPIIAIVWMLHTFHKLQKA